MSEAQGTPSPHASGPPVADDPGLERALDLAGVKASIEARCREAGERLHILSLELEDVRHRPGRPCWILYRLRFRDAGGRRRATWVSARLLDEGQEPDPPPSDVVERYRARAGLPFSPAELRIPERSLVLYPFPVDTALTGLGEASDRNAVRFHLGRFWSPRRLRVRRVRIENRSYRPHSRATFFYEILAEDRRTGVPEIRRLVGKLHAGKPASRLFADQWALWSAGRDRVPLPPPVGFLGAIGATLQEHVGGERLGGLVDQPGFERHVRRTAAALAAFHGLRIPLSTQRRPANEAGAVRRWAGALAGIRPDLESRITGLERRLVSAIMDRARPRAPAHADFHHTNVLVDGDAVRFIDFDDMAWGDPMLDVGRFLSSLRVPARRAFGSISALNEAGEAFLEEYLRKGDGRERDVRLFEAASLLISAGSSFRIQRTDWFAESGMLLDECERVLETAERGVPVALGAAADSPESGGLDVREKDGWTEDGTYMRAVLDQEVQDTYGARMTRCLPETAGPGDRQRILYRASGWKGNSRWEATLAGIRRRKRGGKTLLDNMHLLERILLDDGEAPATFLLPRPVAYVRRLSLLVWEAMPGTPFPETWNDRRAAVEAAAGTARCLVALHRVEIPLRTVWSWEKELARLETRIEEGGPEASSVAERARLLVERIRGRTGGSEDGALRPALRGLDPLHVQVIGDRLGLDRVEGLALAPVGLDAAGFLARLVLPGANGDGPRAAAQVLRSFRRAYLDAEPECGDLGAFTAGMILGTAWNRAGRPGAGALLEQAVEAAASCLDEGREPRPQAPGSKRPDPAPGKKLARPLRDLHRVLARRAHGRVLILSAQGVDVEPLAGEIRKRGADVRIRVWGTGEGDSLPPSGTDPGMEPGTLHTVILRGLMERVQEAATPDILADAWAHVQPGGRLIAVVPNEGLEPVPGGTRRFKRRSLRRALRPLGRPKLVMEQPLRWLVMIVSKPGGEEPVMSPTDRSRALITARHCRGRVVELGSGSGHLSGIIQLRGHEVVGVERNLQKVDEARQLYPDVTFLAGDIRTAGLPDAGFDTAVLAEVLEHLTEDVGTEILDTAFRLVRPGGRLLVSVPNEDCVPHRNHVREFDRRSLRNLLAAYGKPRLIADQPYKWLLMVVEKAR